MILRVLPVNCFDLGFLCSREIDPFEQIAAVKARGAVLAVCPAY